MMLEVQLFFLSQCGASSSPRGRWSTVRVGQGIQHGDPGLPFWLAWS